MEKYDIYQQISERTQGDIYIGIVGPVRTGKSTFIKRFMDLLVIPNIENEFSKERAKDELPQSASGRTIMTTEPKFVPNEAIEIELDETVQFKVRLVDCVGYMVKGAIGHMEDDAPRMVSTPWFDKQIPFVEAAEIGTKKVINDHSTIGLLITTDGSITDIEREDYIEAEERVVMELKEINKPFVMLLNSVNPTNPDTEKLRQELEQKYGIPVIGTDCAHLRIEDLNTIMEKVLFEFPIREIGINIPKWIESLKDDYWLKADMINAIREVFTDITKIREIRGIADRFDGMEFIKRAYVDKINLGLGTVYLEINEQDGLFYRVLSEMTGIEIEGEHRLVSLMTELAKTKEKYDKVQYALNDVKMKGYGIVTPQMGELSWRNLR